ncbi:MAG: alcohol dehydrogenase [Deltaproteobacteria bacterium]|nr:alcohol dehydrogenase [Deltaproteobacteria bacterium]
MISRWRVPPQRARTGVRRRIFDAAKGIDCRMIVGIGGGSVMDVAKIVSVMLTNDVSLRQLLNNNPKPMTKSDMREIYRKLL